MLATHVYGHQLCDARFRFELVDRGTQRSINTALILHYWVTHHSQSKTVHPSIDPEASNGVYHRCGVAPRALGGDDSAATDGGFSRIRGARERHHHRDPDPDDGASFFISSSSRRGRGPRHRRAEPAPPGLGFSQSCTTPARQRRADYPAARGFRLSRRREPRRRRRADPGIIVPAEAVAG